jgi:hypothetical protein
LELRRGVLGEKNSETLTTLDILADLYRIQGSYTQAEILLVQALDLARRIRREDGPLVLEMLDTMAGIYAVDGKYSQAGPFLSKL